MPQFRFNTISRADIERSRGGNIMIQAIDYDGDDHQLITGVPGSGKTTVTIMRAERLINQRKNIIVFTYQNLLKTSLKNIATAPLKKEIFGFFDWYYHVKRFGYLNRTDNETVMLQNMANQPIVDEILIDEGQDFENRIFRALLKKCKRMTVGADNAQKIHERGIVSQEIKLELERAGIAIPVRLQYNYRNTFEIYNFAREFMPDNERANNPIALGLMPRGNGNKPVVVKVLSRDENFHRLKIILENAGDRNIAVLLYHQDEVDIYHNKIQSMGLRCTKYYHRTPIGDNIENILVTTYKSAKGLEFQVVIMPDMHTAMSNENETPEHYYIGCTRATENLYLTVTGQKLPDFFDRFDKNVYEVSEVEQVLSKPSSKQLADDLPF